MLTARSSFWVREVPFTETDPTTARTVRRLARVGRTAVDARANDTVEVGSVRAGIVLPRRRLSRFHACARTSGNSGVGPKCKPLS
jgi:hypothetical protein